nr:MAG: hypothetical protein TU35_07295 [Thermoproteus sp. AZ2]
MDSPKPSSFFPPLEYKLLLALFSIFFLLQFIFREFLFYVAPFMPSTGINMVDLELVGTFAVFGLEVVVPFLLYMTDIPLRTAYLAFVTAMLWGGTALGYLYPIYSSTPFWALASLTLAAFTALSLIIMVYELKASSAPLAPLVALQMASLTLYVADVATEYFGLPLGGLSPFFVYPMLLLAGLGGITTAGYSIYLLTRGFNKKTAAAYAAAAVIGFATAYPLYQLTLYNSFMAHIMSMVFAMGLGVLAPPVSMPAAAAFMGLYIYAIIALAAYGVLARSPLHYAMAAATLIYLTTAFAQHAVVVIFASVIAAANALAYIGRGWAK